jgi:hypothetical protein
LLAGLITTIVGGSAWGQVVVAPQMSLLGASERYALLVSNERAVSLTSVEIIFPTDLRVRSFAEVPGWYLKVLGDSAAARVTGAVWTGVLTPRRLVEFPFIATNPLRDTTLTWQVTQVYADRRRVGWMGKDAAESAPVTLIRAHPIATSATILALLALLGALGLGWKRGSDSRLR